MLSVCRHTARHTRTLQQRAYAAPANQKRYSLRDPLVPPEDPGDNSLTNQRAARTIHIRASSILGISDAYAVIRGIERKFGRVREYRFMRDAEVSSTYQVVLWAAFVSPESFDRVPERGAKLEIPARPIDLAKEGGPGLEDLDGLLDSVQYDGEVESRPGFQDATNKAQKEAGKRLLEVTVKRADSDLRFRPETPQLDMTKPKKIAFGYSFMEWGGFYPLKPLYTESPFSTPSSEVASTQEQQAVNEEPLTQAATEEPLPPDNPNMRLALNKWSQITGRPDPSFADSHNAHLPDPQLSSLDSSPSLELQPEFLSQPPAETSRRIRRAKAKPDADGWEPLSDPPPRPANLDKSKESKAAPASPPARKLSRHERILEQAREQAREQVRAQARMDTDAAAPTEPEDWEKLQESIEREARRMEEAGVAAEGKRRSKEGETAAAETKETKERVWKVLGRWF
ncbi:hypothetical protein BV22DRAFT_1193593 [Leucogyrophana mollusca]|uniref:Uncharacterized protein n=1 Tax=Leucogyrophana mollusca TaxID=85980 RepID=A0ACB8BNE5_9AGAM|nr:hypothetical protein BV22DRAFT_1193593 [Leucogyrophana mollusca]